MTRILIAVLVVTLAGCSVVNIVTTVNQNAPVNVSTGGSNSGR